MEHVKFPKIPHIYWSDSIAENDTKVNVYSSKLFLCEDVVVTEKLDGENTTMYSDGVHARSLDSLHHESRSWVKAHHAEFAGSIPDTIRIVGENVYARHSIGYNKLESYFYVYMIFENGTCLSWDKTVEWCDMFELKTVPVLYRGFWNIDRIKASWNGKSKLGNESEGYVIRNADCFPMVDFDLNVAKYVRADHVQTDEHWLEQPVVPNKLKGK